MSGSDLASSNRRSPTTGYTFSDRGRAVIADRIEIDAERCWGTADFDAPLVSCLMVTEDRPALAARAIECFLAQSYPNKELIVIDSSESDRLQQGIDAICYPPIKLHRMPGCRQPLGELRNIAVRQSAGKFVCQWDDDDLCDPDRLTVQMGAITALSADACFLARQQLWWPTRHIFAVSIRRIWEGTMVCARDQMPLYPPLRRGEDTALAFHVWRTARVVMLDEPRLYTYVFHGANTFGEAHFARHFAAATQQSTGDAYAERLSRLRTRVPIGTDGAASPEPANQNGDNRQRPSAVG